MALADSLFGSEPEDHFQPKFAKSFMGLNPHEVEDYIVESAERINRLEDELREARQQAETATRKYQRIRDDVYGEIAERMADLIRAAERQADKLRREAEEVEHRRVMEATREAEQIRRDAELEAERAKLEADAHVRRANDEAGRVLGGLVTSRDTVMDELLTIRRHLEALLTRVDAARALPMSQPVSTPVQETPARPAARAAAPPTVVRVDEDEVLGAVEGLDVSFEDSRSVRRGADR